MVIPRPQTQVPLPGTFRIDSSTALVAADGAAAAASWLRSELAPPTGLPLPITAGGHGIRLELDDGLGPESYEIEVTTEGARLRGADGAGLVFACQTLLQLLPPAVHRRAPVPGTDWVIPCCHIEDSPRFAWRGVMLDVVRHFLPKREVMRFIDLMSMHRLNTLHLHLTDDQGWRVEIRRFPRLTEIGAWRDASQVGDGADAPSDRRPHGGFYTQDDLRELVGYAAERGITIVPEIEMPGHVQAAVAAYPQLGTNADDVRVRTTWSISRHVLNLEEETVRFFEQVLDEIVDLFPSEIIGVGGDECPTDQWEQDPRTQELMHARGIARERDLQAWFMTRIGAHLARRGRRMYGWDELLEGDVPTSTVIASWRGMTGAAVAARRGHDVVACPDTEAYLDYRQSERDDEPIPVGSPLPLDRCYALDPIPAGLSDDEAARVLGGQANLWSEHIDSARMRDYYAFPRLCAVAEALWSAGPRDLSDFRRRLTHHLRRLEALGVEYRPERGPLPWQTRPDATGRPITLDERLGVVRELVDGIHH